MEQRNVGAWEWKGWRLSWVGQWSLNLSHTPRCHQEWPWGSRCGLFVLGRTEILLGWSTWSLGRGGFWKRANEMVQCWAGLERKLGLHLLDSLCHPESSPHYVFKKTFSFMQDKFGGGVVWSLIKNISFIYIAKQKVTKQQMYQVDKRMSHQWITKKRNKIIAPPPSLSRQNKTKRKQRSPLLSSLPFFLRKRKRKMQLFSFSCFTTRLS